MSNSVRPQRWQPTRLPRPWDSPGKNTGVFVAISFSNAWKWKVKVKLLSRIWLLPTLWPAAHQAPRPWDFPGKNTGVGCHRHLRVMRLGPSFYPVAFPKHLGPCVPKGPLRSQCDPEQGWKGTPPMNHPQDVSLLLLQPQQNEAE